MNLDYCFERLQYEPHRGQLKLHKSSLESRVLIALFGRRGGKSHAASFEAVTELIKPPHPVFGGRCALITAPTADLTKAVFERAHDLVFKHLHQYKPHYSRSERKLSLRRLGSVLYTRSGDKPKSLVSKGYSKVIIDESGFFRDDSFRELEPALLEWPGQLVAIGVPALQNWYFEKYKEAKRGVKGYKAIQLPSIVNPAVSVDEWHRLFKTIPRLEFLRQYCAKFNNPITVLWTAADLEKCKLYKNPAGYEPGVQYYAGLDLARKEDYTVLTIVKLVNGFIEVVETLKIQTINWTQQTDLIAHILNKYQVVACTVDGTGLGDSVIEQLADKTVTGLHAYIFTNESKCQVIDDLTLSIERGEIIIPVQFEDYHNELRIYEQNISRTGLRQFSAPEGFHDDHVISLALAKHAIKFNSFV
jgi:phage terminase large subunit-like protein